MPFALTGLLMPVLLRALSPRVTTVSSAAAGMGMRKINFEDLQGWERYNPWRAYCQSRLAGLMFAMELARRCRTGSRRMLSNAAHPGNVFCGSKADRLSTPLKIIANGIAPFSSQEAGRGALPILRAATAPDAKPGSFYGPSRMFGLKGDPIPMSIPKSARNQLAAQKLWWTAVQLTSVSFEFPEKMLRRYK
jgi:NAD(P)-dependent dehydrogenase (short-subunit alcohol dehydrogenase family)